MTRLNYVNTEGTSILVKIDEDNVQIGRVVLSLDDWADLKEQIDQAIADNED